MFFLYLIIYAFEGNTYNVTSATTDAVLFAALGTKPIVKSTIQINKAVFLILLVRCNACKDLCYKQHIFPNKPVSCVYL